MSVKIYGYGWVGKAMYELFPEATIHDPAQDLFSYNVADVGFICVPTPNNNQAELDTSIVEEVVRNAEEKLLVIRSTVNPGTTDRLIQETGKHIVVQPEYLGETPAHPMLDQTTRQFVIIGGEPNDRRTLIELYTKVYNADTNIRQVTALEAEVIKLSENRAIMFKVLQCQELYDACESAGVDYYTVRDAVYGDDPRFNLWWTFIYPKARGAKSKCIPKDPYAWAAWAKGTSWDKNNAELTQALLKYNEKLIND